MDFSLENDYFPQNLITSVFTHFLTIKKLCVSNKQTKKINKFWENKKDKRN